MSLTFNANSVQHQSNEAASLYYEMEGLDRIESLSDWVTRVKARQSYRREVPVYEMDLKIIIEYFEHMFDDYRDGFESDISSQYKNVSKLYNDTVGLQTSVNNAITNMMPQILVTNVTGGHRVKISNYYDTYQFDVMDGAKGDTGAKGNKGDKGDKGDPFTYSDFTSQQIADLKSPATTAAATANTAAAAANSAASAANSAAQTANTAASLANTKAELAHTKAALADTKATLADTNAGLAATATTNANNAASAANTAKGNADDATTAANNAAAAANAAAEAVASALNGDLAPLFSSYISSLKDVTDGLASYNTYVSGMSNKVNISSVGVSNGIAQLDSNGKVPAAQLPSYVDDVLEYSSVSNFPQEGESGKLYVATDTNATYRWSGSTYVQIASGLALGETVSTAYAGDKGAAAYAHGVTNKGSAFSSGLYKITTNSEGHVTAATAVQKSDITDLGIPASDTTYSNVVAAVSGSGGTAGLMSAADKEKLDGIATGANAYTLPAATTSSLGGVKADGTTITVDNDGTIHGSNSYTLPTMGASIKGGAKLGSGLAVDANDALNVQLSKSASGTSVTCDGAADAPLLKLHIDGKCEQDANPSTSDPKPIRMVRGKNLLNEKSSSWIYGKLINSEGVVSNSDGYKYISEYIPIISGETYSVQMFLETADAFGFTIPFYDSEKSFISRYVAISANYSAYGYNTGTFTTPLNAAYIRCSVPREASRFQIERGSTATQYVQYGIICLAVYDNDTPQSIVSIPAELYSLPDGTKDELTVDAAGEITKIKRCAYTEQAVIDGVSGTVGTDVISTTGQIANGAGVVYKLSSASMEYVGRIEMPEVSDGYTVSVMSEIAPTIEAEWWVEPSKPAGEAVEAVNDLVHSRVLTAQEYDLQVANNVYPGRNITEIPEIAAEVASYDAPWLFLSARIAMQDYSNLRIGDYFNVPLTTGTGTITQNSVRYDIAAFEHYYNCGDAAMGHHIVCVPHAPIDMTGSSYATNTSYIKWNATSTNQGNSSQANPYIISNLHSWELNEYLGMLPTTLQNKLLNHRSLCESRYSSSGNLNASTGWAWADLGKIWSPSEMEVYGCCVWGTPVWSIGKDSQFPIFRETKDRIRGGRVAWWLRVASGSSATAVCGVTSDGNADRYGATYTWFRPVPCFLLGA